MDDEEGRWLTYEELAALRGTSRRAAVMLVRRHRWRRQKDNEGHTRALVPPTWAQPADEHGGAESSGNSSGHGDHYAGRALETLERALVALQDAHARELGTLRSAHEAAIADLRDDRDRARTEAREAQDVAEALRQADEARKARGRLRRAWQAWRGE
jgi:hypothetical protein